MSTITDRLNELITNQTQMASRIGVTRQTLGGYCRDDRDGRKIPFEIALAIADEENVSLDWLAGRKGAVKHISPDVKAVCAYTGLSEESVEVLHYLNMLQVPKKTKELTPVSKWNKNILVTVDKLISDSLPGIKENIEKVKKKNSKKKDDERIENESSYYIHSIFTLITKYLLADDVKIKGSKLDTVCLDLKGFEDCVLPNDVYRQYIANEIIGYLDNKAKEEKHG